MLLAILSVCSEEELAETEGVAGGSTEDVLKRRNEIKRKIRAVGKMQRVYQILRSVLLSHTLRLDVFADGGFHGEQGGIGKCDGACSHDANSRRGCAYSARNSDWLDNSYIR